IRATHMSPAERQQLAASPAVAGLCPITEANLGDGIFDAVAYVAAGGNLGIGSDSNVLISAAQELRLLEYGQRLRDRGRNRLVGRQASTGRTLFDLALAGGAQASGRKIGQLAVGYRGDVVALDQNHPAMVCRSGDDWLDGWIFAADKEVISEVWVGGKQVVSDGRHVSREQARQGFEKVLRGLLSL
ncbi:MAG TPA: formimidoylglutamate deiminase, partial [Rhodospirillales bacterium]|nr:formimidoylglutamate deiminase [Rhodospirillales bacterium]